MNIKNTPEGQETITLPIETLYKILNEFSQDDQHVSIEFHDLDTHQSLSPEEDRVIRFVLWDTGINGEQSIRHCMEWENMPCPKQRIKDLEEYVEFYDKEIKRKERDIEYHLAMKKRANIGISKGMNAIPKELRWDFLKHFDTNLTIKDGLDLVEDPLNNEAIKR